MKTAISIPDEIFEAAEEVAQQLSLSRSELYAKAVKSFVETIRNSEITKQSNEACAEQEIPEVEAWVHKATRTVLRSQEW